MVCGVQVDEALDPRCYATVGIEPRTRALLTPVPYRDALIREGLSSRRQRPFWAITLRAVAGARGRCPCGVAPVAGVESRNGSSGRLAVLCDAEPALIEGLALEQQHALLARNLGERSYTGIPRDGGRRARRRRPTWSWRGRASRCRTTCRSLPPARARAAARRCARGAPAPPARSRSSRTPRRSRPCASASRPRPPWRSTSRPTAARSARPPTGRPPTARCASCRWRRRSAARSSAASSTATRSRRARSCACSPTGARSSPTTPATSSRG